MQIELSLAAVLIILLVINFILVNLLNWSFRQTGFSSFLFSMYFTLVYFILNIGTILDLTSKNQQKPNLLIKTEIIDSVQYYSLIKDDKIYDFITYEEAIDLNKKNN